MITSPALMPAFLPGPLSCASETSAPLVPVRPSEFGNVLVDRLDLHAEPAAIDGAAGHQVLDDVLGGRGGDGEGDADIAARRREDGGVDADHFAIEVEGRAAGIAVVHGSVDLDEVVIRAGADVAAARRDDARRHRAAEAERIADRDHPVADANLGIIGEIDVGELAAAIDLEDREIGLGVGADQLGIELLAVIGDDGEGLAAVDDVVVGDEIAVLGDEEAGALRHRTRAARHGRRGWPGIWLPSPRNSRKNFFSG